MFYSIFQTNNIKQTNKQKKFNLSGFFSCIMVYVLHDRTNQASISHVLSLYSILFQCFTLSHTCRICLGRTSVVVIEKS